MGLFKLKNGIIPACDVTELDRLSFLVKETYLLDFIQGYKLGMEITISHGIYNSVERIRKYSDLPIIYDHQKFGTDIPAVCSGQILKILKSAGVQALIIFPQAGVETLRNTVLACQEVGLIPIVGGEMTHKGYLVKDSGYIADDGPERMYIDASRLGVEYFVVPGTRRKSMERYKSILQKHVKGPKFLFPGIGKGQGGDIAEAFDAVSPCDSYAIVGRGIYAEKEPGEATKRLWSAVSTGIG